MLKLGTDRVDITPPKGIYLIGYGDRSGGNRSIRDRLTATATVWTDQNGNRVAAVFADLLGINREVYQRIEDRISLKLRLNGLMISCLHTHSGPVAWAPEYLSPVSLLKDLGMRAAALPAGLHQPRGLLSNKRYIDNLVAGISEAVIKASTELNEIEMFQAAAPFNEGINRREKTAAGGIIIGKNPDGPAPEDVRIVQCRSKKSGKPLLNIVNIDCHPVHFGPASYAVSADWPGEMRRNLEAELPGRTVVMQGGSGNINPDGMRHQAEADVRMQEAGVVRLGRAAARSVTEACGGMEAVDDEAGVLSLERRVDIPTRPGRGYRRELAESAGMPPWIVDPVLNLRYPWKTEKNSVGGVTTTPVYCRIMKIGSLCIAGLSMETFFETSEAVRKLLPGTALFSGYTNGLTGYLPTASAFDAGGYEVETSPYMYRLPGLLDRSAEQTVVETFRQMIAETAEQYRNSSGPGKIGVRQVRRSDEDAVTEICHRTFNSDPVFPYPELVGYRWASWYVRHSSDYSFVAVDENDRPVGYILCAPDTKLFHRGYISEMEPLIKDKLRQLKREDPEIWAKYRRTFLPPVRDYGWPFMASVVREYPAHMHIDLLPGFQRGGLGGRMMERLLKKLESAGIRGLHLIVDAANSNAIGYYKHHRFKEIKSLKIRSTGILVLGRRI